MDRLIEELVLSLRWLLLPLYFALFAVVFGIYAMVGKDLWHLAADFSTFHDTDLVLLLCDVLDLVLVANLLVMVAVSSYESYLSRIAAPVTHSPEWLGKLDSGNVKVKVAVAVTMISMIHLLRAFMKGQGLQDLMILAGVQLVFVVSALGIAAIDRTRRVAGSQ
jgi:uncharacterized protein (TIGR00645 family)